MPQYPNNMHPGSDEQSPRRPDDRKRASAHYDFPDMYNSVAYNEPQRSPQRSPRRISGAAIEGPPSQPRQNQQPMAPGEQGRPPITDNGPVRRGPTNGNPRPPSYPGAPHEELLNKTKAANQQAQQAQQQRRRGYRRTDSSEDVEQVAAPLPFDGRSESISRSNQSMPATRDRRNSPPKNRTASPEPVSPIRSDGSPNHGNAIQRLPTPSVMTSVLQPLDGKVNEYGAQMNEAQKQMAQLDTEMATLQERRREAENRFMMAKTKHDDYRRQYQGVERALRGEPNVFSPMNFEDVESRPSTQQTQQTARPPQSPRGNSRAESWDSVQQKSGSRFRLSRLFSAA